MVEPGRELEPSTPPTAAPTPEIAGVTRASKLLALAIAALSDAVSLAAQLAPPVQIGVDIATGALLFAVLGFRWPLLPVLVIEAIPGLAAFPTWLLAVGVLAGFTPTRAR
jgi:hypothetical protein